MLTEIVQISVNHMVPMPSLGLSYYHLGGEQRCAYTTSQRGCLVKPLYSEELRK